MFSRQSRKSTALIPFLFLLIFFFSLPPGFPRQSPVRLYRPAYLQLKEAEKVFRDGDYEKASAALQEAETLFLEIRENFPDWSPDTISARLKKCRDLGEAASARRAEEKSWQNPLRVHFIDVGQGDSTLVQCPDGSNILIDGGSVFSYPFLIEYLKNLGLEKIDLLVASHPHGDHIGGLIKVLETFPVGTVLDSGKEHTSEYYLRFMEKIKARSQTRFKLARKGDRFSFGRVKLIVLHPSSQLPDNLNDVSIVLKLIYGEESFLFTGDAEDWAEKQVLGSGFSLKSTVLKVGHHGSKTSTSPTFLNRVSPRVAVILVGENNVYGHPVPQILRRLKAHGVEVYRTDLHGTVLVESSGKSHRLKFPGKAVLPEYEIPPEYEDHIIASRISRIYHPPLSRYYRNVPPADRVYFKTSAEAEQLGYQKSWY